MVPNIFSLISRIKRQNYTANAVRIILSPLSVNTYKVSMKMKWGKCMHMFCISRVPVLFSCWKRSHIIELESFLSKFTQSPCQSLTWSRCWNNGLTEYSTKGISSHYTFTIKGSAKSVGVWQKLLLIENNFPQILEHIWINILKHSCYISGRKHEWNCSVPCLLSVPT